MIRCEVMSVRVRRTSWLLVLSLSVTLAARAQSAAVTSETATHQNDKVVATKDNNGQPLPSPRHALEFSRDADGTHTHITLSYGAPSVRGRTVYGVLVPYNKWWRAGANEATSLVTDRAIKIGDLMVPAGSYTLDVLPTESGWQLIVNKRTGQWGTQYDPAQDLGRVPMSVSNLSSPQEVLSYSFDHETPHSAMLHIRWADKDAAVPVEFPHS